MAIIDVQQAVENATSYFAKLLPVQDVRLEEVEISDDERCWYVTLSALVPIAKDAFAVSDLQAQFSAMQYLFKPPVERVYKIFTVDGASAAVRSMKIRQVA